ncbi:cellulose binding domain-containing protein [Kineosporia sp. J2-2]|uniref:Cellulose binding domain-containing protein n=1 Tax=Kineosporia corallincola TaxID=2835133 RepID=A0ABS5TCV8_9ACTN|nr:cellulose binding domain-containing protein [Kineosporia corallincola]MBT0768026.1 cellulose binding domain-containing protein [Kineosporia corallincola]
MRHRLLMTAAALAAAVGLVQAPSAGAATTLCEQYATAKIQGGKYIVQNNRWGTSSEQCIDVTDTGFTISKQDGVNPTNGAPTAYPSVFWGCHYNNCTNGFSPIRADSTDFGKITTKAGLTYISSGNWNASYDIWFDPTARKDGQNTGAEIMVWTSHSGPPQPYGSKVATGVTIAGSTYDVWYGNSGWNVVSYVRTTAAADVSFTVDDFYKDSVTRGYAQRSWYLTSVQAGFEPWSGGKGLAVKTFSVNAPVTPPTCTAAFALNTTWNTGFTADVTVKNTGGTATGSWKVKWTWPGNQTISSIWNATETRSGKTVTASSMDYNSVVPAGGTTGFGMVVNGAATTPALTCTAT